ncbi:MAG: tandem-95 repeat protein, partial [Bacteroidia bacterium]|nr:tandem-95 repeat protein [Bacteroidia bacterium]
GCDTVIVIINVIPVNDPPVIVDSFGVAVDTLRDTTPEDTPIVICINAIDPDGDAYAIDTLSGPSNGTYVQISDSCFIYSPDSNFNGDDTLVLVLCDTGTPTACDTVVVIITVTPVNDPPVAIDDFANTVSGGSVVINVQGNDYDVDGDSLTTGTTFGGPSHGTVVINPDGSITYTADSNFVGNDTLFYVICDGGNPNLCDTAMVVITVGTSGPVAVDDYATVANDTSVVIDVTANDQNPLGGGLTVTLCSQPANGTATVNPNGTITYVPNSGYVGTDSFCYMICDTLGNCATAMVYINVTPGLNNPPDGRQDCFTTPENTPIMLNVGWNDFDPDGDPITTTAIVCGPYYGQAYIINNDSIFYIPNFGFTGLDTICYVVCDNGNPALCDTTHAYVMVVPINDPPVAVNDSATTDSGKAVVIAVKLNDSDPNGDSLTVGIITNPTNGSASINSDGTINYIPNPGFTGVDSFAYVICDQGFPPLCDTAWVFITVTPPPSCQITIPNAFTPNGDNQNDLWVIQNIGCYPNNQLWVYNRWGNLVYTAAPYNNTWDGTDNNGNPLPDGTYYYVLDLGDGNPPRTGFVIIFR